MTTRRFGDRATFAIEVGGFDGGLRIVDLWAGGKWLTVRDNVAYVPSFCHLMRSTVDNVRRGEVRPSPAPGCSPEQVFWLLCEDSDELAESHWFMHWGETVDNLRTYAYLDGDLVVMFSYYGETPDPDDQGRAFVARIPSDEFVATVEAAADFLWPADR